MKNLVLVVLWGAFLAIPGLSFGAEFEAIGVAEIQAAFNTAASNGEDDTIRIAAGTHAVGTTLTFVSTEQHSLRIEGQGRGVTVLDGGGQVRVMALDTTQASIDYGTTVTVTGITFRNGYTENGGGGGLSIIADKASIVVRKCVFINNVAQPTESTFIDPDRANGGGGLFAAVGEMRRSSGGDVFVEQCMFSGNSSSVFGGGAYIYATGDQVSFTTLRGNFFKDNRATLDGGGVWVETNHLRFINNTVKENQAGLNGGGILVYSGRWINVYNNIVWSNNADVNGLDIFIDDGWTGTKYINLYSNTFSETTFRVGDTKSEGENSNEDPLLDENLTLLPGSPCIDTGNNDAPELACGDYYGQERIYGGTVDRGAVEFGSINMEDPDCDNADPIDPPDPNPTPSADGGSSGGCFIGTAMTVDPDSDAYKAAKRIAERYNSSDFQSKIAAEKKRLKPKVKRQCRQLNQDVAINARDQVNPARPELLVFISASMPPDTTKALARDAHRVKKKSDVRFVLRGFPEDGLTDYVQGIQASNYNLNLTVDPFLFDTYEVEQVPAVVVNRTVKINHPHNLKSALTRIQAASDQQLTALIRDLNW